MPTIKMFSRFIESLFELVARDGVADRDKKETNGSENDQKVHRLLPVFIKFAFIRVNSRLISFFRTSPAAPDSAGSQTSADPERNPGRTSRARRCFRPEA